MPDRAQIIEQRLRQAFSPVYLDLVDETFKHNVPPDAQSHWKAVIVSEAFAGKRPVQRHRAVYQALGDELRQGIHALSLDTLSPAEWAERGQRSDHVSPPCHGGSKAENPSVAPVPPGR